MHFLDCCPTVRVQSSLRVAPPPASLAGVYSSSEDGNMYECQSGLCLDEGGGRRLQLKLVEDAERLGGRRWIFSHSGPSGKTQHFPIFAREEAECPNEVHLWRFWDGSTFLEGNDIQLRCVDAQLEALSLDERPNVALKPLTTMPMIHAPQVSSAPHHRQHHEQHGQTPPLTPWSNMATAANTLLLETHFALLMCCCNILAVPVLLSALYGCPCKRRRRTKRTKLREGSSHYVDNGDCARRRRSSESSSGSSSRSRSSGRNRRSHVSELQPLPYTLGSLPTIQDSPRCSPCVRSEPGRGHSLHGSTNSSPRGPSSISWPCDGSTRNSPRQPWPCNSYERSACDGYYDSTNSSAYSRQRPTNRELFPDELMYDEEQMSSVSSSGSSRLPRDSSCEDLSGCSGTLDDFIGLSKPVLLPPAFQSARATSAPPDVVTTARVHPEPTSPSFQSMPRPAPAVEHLSEPQLSPHPTKDDHGNDFV